MGGNQQGGWGGPQDNQQGAFGGQQNGQGYGGSQGCFQKQQGFVGNNGGFGAGGFGGGMLARQASTKLVTLAATTTASRTRLSLAPKTVLMGVGRMLVLIHIGSPAKGRKCLPVIFFMFCHRNQHRIANSHGEYALGLCFACFASHALFHFGWEPCCTVIFVPLIAYFNCSDTETVVTLLSSWGCDVSHLCTA